MVALSGRIPAVFGQVVRERIHLIQGWPEDFWPLCTYGRFVGCGSVSFFVLFLEPR